MNASEYRAEAAHHETVRAESWERSDTDGFVSQWASGIMGQLARTNAEIAERGGTLTFERLVLQRADGTPVPDARRVTTRYGTRWAVGPRGATEWLPYAPKRAATLTAKGYREATERVVAPARADTWAPPGARGLSGATSVRVRIFRADMPEWKHDAQGWHVASLD